MEFAALGSVDATSLRWLRREDKTLQFDLLSGDRTLAVLRWNGPNGTLASATTATGVWTLKRVGFLNPRVTVRAQGAAEDLAELSVHLNYHRIQLKGGRAFRFHRAGVLIPAWKVYREDGAETLHVEPVRAGRKLEGGAVISPAASTALPEFLLLAVLSWYFIALAWFEDEAIATLEGPDSAPASGTGSS